MAKAKPKTEKPAGDGAAPEQPAAAATEEASTPTEPPALGSVVCYHQLENGPRVEQCVALVTGARSATHLDLLVCRAGVAPRPVENIGFGSEANKWAPFPPAAPTPKT